MFITSVFYLLVDMDRLMSITTTLGILCSKGPYGSWWVNKQAHEKLQWQWLLHFCSVGSPKQETGPSAVASSMRDALSLNLRSWPAVVWRSCGLVLTCCPELGDAGWTGVITAFLLFEKKKSSAQNTCLWQCGILLSLSLDQEGNLSYSTIVPFHFVLGIRLTHFLFLWDI